MLDGPHAGPQGRHDARLAVAVRRDHPVGQPRDLHDRPQFRRRELLVDRVVDLGEHAAGRAYLDQLRVAPELLADRPGAVVRPVRQPHHAVPPGVVAHPVEREGVQVAVAAGGAQDRARAVDRRAVDGALGDRAGQVDAEAAHVAHRGDPRVERGPQIPGAPGRPQRLGLERELRQVEGPGPEEMPVALPHPRHHRRHPGHRRPGGRRRRPGRAGVADPGSVQHDHPVADGTAVPGYEQLSLDSVHRSSSLGLGCDPRITADHLDGPATRGPSWIAGRVHHGGPRSGPPAAFFTDSIDVCAVAGTGHALYRTYDCPATGAWAGDPWALGRQGHRGEEA